MTTSVSAAIGPGSRTPPASSGRSSRDNITGQARVTARKGEHFETKGCLKWEKVG
ncbi:hypothetical protein [Streptomyces sp. NPDC057284]|uniref:hypothetical protein n=1 Tax=Streptomyces sp. NPDC057284 TaxID=3346083 RepID=UPI00362D029D